MSERINLGELRARPSVYDTSMDDHESVPLTVDELNTLVEAVAAAHVLIKWQGMYDRGVAKFLVAEEKAAKKALSRFEFGQDR